MKLETNKASGRIYARLSTGNPAKRYVRMTLGTKSRDEAKKRARDANLSKIEAAMQAGNLSQQAIARLTAGKKLNTEDAAVQWLDGAVTRGESPSTTAKNRAVISQWLDFAKVKAKAPMLLTEQHVEPFINRPGDAGAAARTRQLSVLRQFFRYLGDLGLAQGNAARRVRVNLRALTHEQREKKVVQPFTAAEVKRILSETEGWWRWAAGISQATALRLGDICQLEHACLGVPGHIVVWTDKRDRRVCLPINDRVTPGLAGILAEIPPADSRFVFPEQEKEYADISRGRPKFSVQFSRLLQSLGIEGKSFHCLRHTAITRWARDGFTLDDCKTFAGHGNSKTTKGYIHA